MASRDALRESLVNDARNALAYVGDTVAAARRGENVPFNPIVARMALEFARASALLAASLADSPALAGTEPVLDLLGDGEPPQVPGKANSGLYLPQ